MELTEHHFLQSGTNKQVRHYCSAQLTDRMIIISMIISMVIISMIITQPPAMAAFSILCMDPIIGCCPNYVCAI